MYEGYFGKMPLGASCLSPMELIKEILEKD